MTERHSGTLRLQGTQDVHASPEPGRGAEAGEAGTSEEVRLRAAADRRSRAGINSLSGGQRPTSAVGFIDGNP